MTISDCNVPDDQTLISEAEDQALPNSEICADSAFTVEVATSKMDEETSPLGTGSLNKVATITEAMLHSETASTASSESAFNKDHEEIPQFNTTSTVSTNERAAASPDPFVENIETASASQRMFPPGAE